MSPDDITKKFESQDPHAILDGVWAILKSTDKDTLSKLAPHIPTWKAKIKKINLGGMVYRNADHFDLAMSYIKEMCNDGCHCFVYKSTSLFPPEIDAKNNFISISKTTVDKEKYETRFDVQCNFCNKQFKVTEVMGWHVPWYKWEAQ